MYVEENNSSQHKPLNIPDANGADKRDGIIGGPNHFALVLTKNPQSLIYCLRENSVTYICVIDET